MKQSLIASCWIACALASSAAWAQSGDEPEPPVTDDSAGDRAEPSPAPPDDAAESEPARDSAAATDETPADPPSDAPDAAEPASPMDDAQPAVDPVDEALPPLESQPLPESDYEADQQADADDGGSSYTGPFRRGSIGVSIVVGSGQFGDRNYLIVGGGLSYFVINGLSVGLDGDTWLLDEPRVSTLTPQVRYVLWFVPVVQPYVGTFYRHYFVGGGFDDLNSVGGRAGVYLFASGGSYLGLGAIYEKFLSCADSFRACDGWYPELSVGLSF